MNLTLSSAHSRQRQRSAQAAQFQAPAVDEWAFVPATDMFLVVGEAGDVSELVHLSVL